MKASSLLRYIRVGCFVCGLFLAATGVAYAGATGTGNNDKEETCEQQEQVIDRQQRTIEDMAVVPVTDQQKETANSAPKQAEVKKEEANTGMFSFSFIYYLFYKTNFSESTNNAFKASLQAFISRIFG